MSRRGVCQSADSYPKPGFRLSELGDVGVGETRDYPRGCCPPLARSGYRRCVERGFSWPTNGEFEFALGSDCSMCSNPEDGYGCECGGNIGGGRYIKGKRPAVTRMSFLGDKVKCCTNSSGSAIIDGKTCDPRFRGPTAPGCADVMRAHCNNKDNFFKSECKEWLQSTNSAYKDQLANYYCQESDDPFCACYATAIPDAFRNDPVKMALFRCLDPKCEGGNNPRALKPYNLQCPTTYTSCQQNDVKLQLLESGIDQATIENKCGQIILDGSSPSVPTDSEDSDSTNRRGLIIGLSVGGALLVLIVLIVIFVMASRRRRTQ